MSPREQGSIFRARLFFNIKNLAPAPILTLGALLQTSRLLGGVVRNQAYVLAYIDGFLVIGWFIIGGLVLTALLRPAPKP